MECQSTDRHFLERHEESSHVEIFAVMAMQNIDAELFDPTNTHAEITDRKKNIEYHSSKDAEFMLFWPSTTNKRSVRGKVRVKVAHWAI